MNYIKDYFKRLSEKRADELRDEAVLESVLLYQVQEYKGELWLTYRGNLICPCSMLKSEPVESLSRMRELYVERKSV